MSDNNMVNVIIQFGQANLVAELQSIVEKMDKQELQDMCLSVIRKGDLTTFFDCLRSGFSDTVESKEKAFNVISSVLKSLNQEDVDPKATHDLINCITADIKSFNYDQLMGFVNICLESIRTENSKTVYWKDFLPQLLKEISGIECLLANAILITGMEYRDIIIKRIINAVWRLDILCPLAAMFKDIDLTLNDREQILTKFGEYLWQLDLTQQASVASHLFSICSTPPLMAIAVSLLQKCVTMNEKPVSAPSEIASQVTEKVTPITDGNQDVLPTSLANESVTSITVLDDEGSVNKPVVKQECLNSSTTTDNEEAELRQLLEETNTRIAEVDAENKKLANQLQAIKDEEVQKQKRVPIQKQQQQPQSGGHCNGGGGRRWRNHGHRPYMNQNHINHWETTPSTYVSYGPPAPTMVWPRPQLLIDFNQLSNLELLLIVFGHYNEFVNNNNWRRY